MNNIVELQEMVEKYDWFVMYYFKEEGKINVEYVLGYETEPSKENISLDSYDMVEDLKISEEDIKKLHIHILNKQAMKEMVEVLK